MFEALLEIPGMLHALREMFARKRSDPAAGLAKLETMRASLLAFASAGALIDKPRQLHQHLQRVDNILAPCIENHAHATKSGRFEAFDFELGTARSCWEKAKPDSLDVLIEFLGSTQFVQGTVPLRTENGATLWIPPWGFQICRLRGEIEECFQVIDGHTPRGESVDDVYSGYVREVASRLKALSDQVKTQLRFADQEVRDRASEITKALAALSRT